MRQIKMLCLSVTAALAAMALIGAGTASATKLCSENKSPCPAGSVYKKGTSIKASLVPGTKAVMSSGFITVECSESSMSGKTQSEGGSGVAVSGEITSITWKSCETSGGSKCTASSLGTPWSAEVTGSGGNGTMTVSNAAGVFTCSATCEYEAKSASLSVSGGSPAKVKASNIGFSKIGGSFLCSSSASWSAEYEVSAPSPLFVVSA